MCNQVISTLIITYFQAIIDAIKIDTGASVHKSFTHQCQSHTVIHNPYVNVVDISKEINVHLFNQSINAYVNIAI